MVHLQIVDGMLRSPFNELKDELEKLVGHELRQLKVDDNSNLSGYIGIGSHGRHDENDVLRILAKHCTEFTVNAEEDDFDASHLFSDFVWDGQKLIQQYKTRWGSIDEIEDWTWVIEE
jgi:hypothetical protein